MCFYRSQNEGGFVYKNAMRHYTTTRYKKPILGKTDMVTFVPCGSLGNHVRGSQRSNQVKACPQVQIEIQGSPLSIVFTAPFREGHP
jgi:hypothetical protein